MYQKIIHTISNVVRKILLALIFVYQKCMSPFLGNRCRFYPSCSEYAKDAMQSCSVMKGLCLIARRLLRCHPFCKGGVDLLETHTTNKVR